MLVAFRCDGDDRVGAGHVARCAQLAHAFRSGGVEVVFAGTYAGVARRLVAALPTAPDIPAGADAVVVDSYEIPAAEIETLARRLPVAAVEDGPRAPAVTGVLAYHLDSAERTAIPAGTVAITGPDHAPIRPACVRSRRPRKLARGLVTVGGGTAGEHLIDEAAEALGRLVERVDVVRPGTAPVTPAEMLELIAAADVAVSAAGSTPYELACAGVPAVLVAVAENQVPIARAFDAAGVALGLADPADLAGAVAKLADAEMRKRLAASGPALIDGYGAFRARDALLAAFAGRPAPRVLRYRPATPADAELLHAWRNDPEVRAVSRTTEPIPFEQHERWLALVLADPDRSLLVVEHEGEPAGTVRFDRSRTEAEISVTVAPGRRGGGLGAQMVREAAELELASRPELTEIVAEVREDNLASLRAFERAGYRRKPARPAETSVLLGIGRDGFRGRLH